MEVIDPEKKYTPETYLKFEKDGDIRHEFVAGYIYSMSGSSRVHNTITNNLMIETGPKLRGQRCRPYANDVKVHIKLGHDEFYYYPDFLVTCDPKDSHEYYVDKPTLITEVLSPSTERLDRREKFFAYMQLESLREYVLVSQEKREVILYRRETDWEAEYLNDNQLLKLRSINLDIPLNHIYADTNIQ